MNFDEAVRLYQPTCEQETQDKRMMLEYIRLFDNTLERANEIAHFTASSWIVDKARKKAVMAYHNIYDTWAWTGGHADGESDLAQVALREAAEETGLIDLKLVTEEPISLEIIPVPPHFKRGKFVVPHLHLNLTYLIEADEHEQVRIKPDENSGVKWFAFEDALKATSEKDMIPIYTKLIQKASER